MDSLFEIYMDHICVGRACGMEETAINQATDYAKELALTNPTKEILIYRTTGRVSRICKTVCLSSGGNHYIIRTVLLEQIPV